jgi:hypothetical protein
LLLLLIRRRGRGGRGKEVKRNTIVVASILVKRFSWKFKVRGKLRKGYEGLALWEEGGSSCFRGY